MTLDEKTMATLTAMCALGGLLLEINAHGADLLNVRVSRGYGPVVRYVATSDAPMLRIDPQRPTNSTMGPAEWSHACAALAYEFEGIVAQLSAAPAVAGVAL